MILLQLFVVFHRRLKESRRKCRAKHGAVEKVMTWKDPEDRNAGDVYVLGS